MTSLLHGYPFCVANSVLAINVAHAISRRVAAVGSSLSQFLSFFQLAQLCGSPLRLCFCEPGLLTWKSENIVYVADRAWKTFHKLYHPQFFRLQVCAVLNWTISFRFLVTWATVCLGFPCLNLSSILSFLGGIVGMSCFSFLCPCGLWGTVENSSYTPYSDDAACGAISVYTDSMGKVQFKDASVNFPNIKLFYFVAVGAISGLKSGYCSPT